jgi:hypothetical protein
MKTAIDHLRWKRGAILREMEEETALLSRQERIVAALVERAADMALAIQELEKKR